MLKKALIAWFCWLLPAGLPAAQIPPRPETDAGPAMLHDTARLLFRQTDREQVRFIQQSAWEQSKLPIVVVTIHSMSDCGHSGSIESLARDWFNAWRIGAPRKPSASSAAAPVAANKESRGVLLLVSLRDRRARIELGTAWGRSRDAFCQQVLDQDLIPAFKRKDYSSGIVAGVTALSALPESQPTTSENGVTDLLASCGVLLMMGVIGGLPVLALYSKRARVVLGVGILGVGVFSCGGIGYAVFAVTDNWWELGLVFGLLAAIGGLALIVNKLGLSSSQGYSSSSSGGYSGGGGASGS